MKGFIRTLTTFSLATVAVSGLVMAPQDSALALSEQEILEKLSTVPVFLIVNEEGQSLTASVNNDEADVQVPVVFLNADEAQAFLDRAETEQAEFSGDARIAVLPLSDVYAEASEQLDGPNSLVYIPSSESVSQANQIAEREVQGVPLFAAIDIERDQYLLTGNNVLPMFFSLRDLQSQISPLVESNPELENSIGIEVVTLEALLSNMNSDDPDINQLLELIQFVPSSELIQRLQPAEGTSGGGNVPQ